MPSDDITVLKDLPAGDRASAERLFPVLYDEIHALARSYMRSERSDHTLQPTALVHEAYLRLAGKEGWEDRSHFMAVAALTMRRILVDHARRRRAEKRGGSYRVTVAEGAGGEDRTYDILALDEALDRLAKIDARKSRIVELRFFGGLGYDETANVLGISRATAQRDWQFARAWLGRNLTLSES